MNEKNKEVVAVSLTPTIHQLSKGLAYMQDKTLTGLVNELCINYIDANKELLEDYEKLLKKHNIDVA